MVTEKLDAEQSDERGSDPSTEGRYHNADAEITIRMEETGGYLRQYEARMSSHN